MVEQLREMIRDSGYSLNQLSKVCGVDTPRLSRFMTGKRGLSLEAVDEICKALRVRLSRPPRRREEE